MKSDSRKLVFAYLRLSREEAASGESSSITNQRQMIANYCTQNHMILVNEFVDDGYSGGNFDRPGFQRMLAELKKGKANTVITKDLSRLGRDMVESSYYAEQYFPENGIRYLTIADNFDTLQDNIMAPFLFAMNEVYLRDGSRKVRDVLRSKRENGQYCACPPYGYRKDTRNRNQLVPDEATAPIVLRIFQAAASGESSHSIANALNRDKVIPPLKYRVLYRDQFSEEGAARVSDYWNYTTVKRILKNQVYLGHTILGKSKKVSVKSKKKINLPQEDWVITPDTHEPIVTPALFHLAQRNLANRTKSHWDRPDARRSIFSGLIFCAKCGHALCSGGGVYKGNRIKYWRLYCNHQSKSFEDPCDGVSIPYADIQDIVLQELNTLLAMTKEEVDALVQDVLNQAAIAQELEKRKLQAEKAQARLDAIDRMIAKLYMDNAQGRLNDDRLAKMTADLEEESVTLREVIQRANEENPVEVIAERYKRFFEMAQKYTRLEKLDREILLTFIDRIEVGPKILPEGFVRASRKHVPYQQEVKIFYRFVGTFDPAAEPHLARKAEEEALRLKALEEAKQQQEAEVVG